MKLKKTLVLAALLTVILLIGGYTGYHGYKNARQHRLVKQARMFLQKSNQKKALLSLQRAIKYNPKDVEACRLMAELAEMSRSPSALLWRSKVVDLKPHSTEDRFALAQTALMLQDYASATNALEGVDPEDKKKAAFHNIAGMAASAINRLPEAEAHFVEARRLEPWNVVPQMNLAVVRLHSTNVAALAEARTTLKALSGNATNSFIRC
jgi:Flp pilus assembly protein TadD